METLLQTQAVTYAQAARITLEASDTAVIADPAEAFRYATDKKWLPQKVSPEANARLDHIALLLVHSFQIKGGILYTITKAPLFAYRELQYRNVIQGRTDPHMKVSGDTLLFLIGRLLSQKEDAQAVAAKKESDPLAEERAALAKEREELAKERQALAAEREALAERINTLLAEHKVADTHAIATNEGITISLSNIQFLADSTELPETERAKIREIASILRSIPGRLLIAGHTAMAGTAEGQIALSKERAQAVADYLVQLGSRRDSEITTAGYGAGRPIAGNETEAGRAQNRRVEITILEH